MQNGPFNIVFHGIKPDWIEEEMADDPDFKKDVLELRMKKLLKEEVSSICLFEKRYIKTEILSCYKS